jgi:hypothetical protein
LHSTTYSYLSAAFGRILFMRCIHFGYLSAFAFCCLMVGMHQLHWLCACSCSFFLFGRNTPAEMAGSLGHFSEQWAQSLLRSMSGVARLRTVVCICQWVAQLVYCNWFGFIACSALERNVGFDHTWDLAFTITAGEKRKPMPIQRRCKW